MLATVSPLPQYFDLSGSPLDGRLYFGTVGGNPETSPVTVYWDAAATQPAAQPLDVRAGYVVRNGTASAVYAPDGYSLTIRDLAGRQVLYTQNSQLFFGTQGLASSIDPAGGAGLVGFSSALAYAAGTVGKSLKDLLSTGGSALVKLIQLGTGAVERDVQDKARDAFDVRDFMTAAQRADVKAGTMLYDLTSAYNAALAAAYAAGLSAVQAADGINRIDGTISMPAGVGLFSDGVSSEYYFGDPYAAVPGAKLYKTSVTGASGPIIKLVSGASIRGLYLHHDKSGGATTGIVQMGGSLTSDVCYNARVQDCRMYGKATADITGSTSCVGIYFPDSDLATSKQRYFNKITGNYITNCDIAWRLGSQSNANQFTGNITRQCYVHNQLDGSTSECVDNTFVGNTHMNIGALPTTTSIVFRLLNTCKFNEFDGYTTECNGKAFDISAGSTLNDFDGLENESIASYVPLGNWHKRYGQPVVRGEVLQNLLIDPTRTTDRYIFGRGNKINFFQNVSGTLPQCAGGAYPQALVAANANSRVVVQFDPAAFKKSIHPTMYVKLKVFASAPSAAGTSVAECEFIYRPTSTGAAAGVLSVLRASVKGAAIAGLHFISGKTGGTEFRIGVVGGTASAAAMNFLAVSMEIDGLTYDANVVDMSKFAAATFVSTAATANDVTDAVSLLTVADTVI